MEMRRKTLSGQRISVGSALFLVLIGLPGCAGWGRRPATTSPFADPFVTPEDPLPVPELGEPEPTQVDKPVLPESTPTQPPTGNDNGFPEPMTPTPQDDGGDAPRWKPLQAPPREPVDAEPTHSDVDVDLGNPEMFPVLPGLPPNSADAETTGELAAGSTTRPVTSTQAKAGAKWVDAYESTKRRPIQTQTFGSGARRVAIIGSLYGNDTQSVSLMDALLQHLASLPAEHLDDFELLLVRTPNPDGLMESTRTNSRGVDLNRNFPSVRFTAAPSRQTGPHAASEVETQVLMRLLREFQPQRVIHVRGSFGSRPLVLLNDDAVNGMSAEVKNKTQDQLSEWIGCRSDFGGFSGEFKAGSLEEFVTQRMNAEAVSVLLPANGFPSLDADGLTVLALAGSVAVSDSQPETPDESKPGQAASPDQMNSASAISDTEAPINRDEEVTGDGQRGFVEFLPPPPNGASGDDRSARYYELPPPPGK